MYPAHCVFVETVVFFTSRRGAQLGASACSERSICDLRPERRYAAERNENVLPVPLHAGVGSHGRYFNCSFLFLVAAFA